MTITTEQLVVFTTLLGVGLAVMSLFTAWGIYTALKARGKERADWALASGVGVAMVTFMAYQLVCVLQRF